MICWLMRAGPELGDKDDPSRPISDDLKSIKGDHIPLICNDREGGN